MRNARRLSHSQNVLGSLTKGLAVIYRLARPACCGPLGLAGSAQQTAPVIDRSPYSLANCQQLHWQPALPFRALLNAYASIAISPQASRLSTAQSIAYVRGH